MRNTEEGTKRSIGRSSINHQSILGIPSRISPYSYCEIRIDRACGDCVLGGMSLEYMRNFFEQLNKRWSSCLIHIQQLLPRRLYISKRHQTSSVIKIGDILTSVTLQYLHDLTRLQVPNVRFMILASCNDPFPTRYAKACRDAVFAVNMASVRFQTSSRLIIPKTDRVVMSCGEDVFGIR